MPQSCIVVDCGSNSSRDKISFFSVPAETHHRFLTEKNELTKLRRQKWIAAIKRDDLTPSKLKYEKVCSKHFISGKPAALLDQNDPDWVPSLNMGYSSTTSRPTKRKADVERKQRVDKRKRLKMDTEIIPLESMHQDQDDMDIPPPPIETGVYSQTKITLEELTRLFNDLSFSNNEIIKLKKKTDKFLLTKEALQNNNIKCKYYTGLDFKLLNIIFEDIREYIPHHFNTVLEPFSVFLLALMKLRLNLDFKDLAYRFGVARSTASLYFECIVNILYKRYKNLIIWPDNSVIGKNVPRCFREVLHERTTVIIDCFEVFIQKPANYLTYQQCWSNYKHHVTVKFLIGITPQGTVSFISNTWGGRVSDKQITELSKFLDNVNPNDIVLADRGFLIKDTLAVYRAKLVIPAFTKGRNQLNPN